MTYVDAYLIPLRTEKLAEYERFSRQVAAVYREYGALRVVDCRLDSDASGGLAFHAEEARASLVDDGPLRDFEVAADARSGETVILSWTEWPSKQARDERLARALADPRVQPREEDGILFEGRRLIAGAFAKLIDV